MNIKINKHGEFDIDISKEELLILLDKINLKDLINDFILKNNKIDYNPENVLNKINGIVSNKEKEKGMGE